MMTILTSPIICMFRTTMKSMKLRKNCWRHFRTTVRHTWPWVLVQKMLSGQQIWVTILLITDGEDWSQHTEFSRIQCDLSAFWITKYTRVKDAGEEIGWCKNRGRRSPRVSEKLVSNQRNVMWITSSTVQHQELSPRSLPHSKLTWGSTAQAPN